MSNLLKLIILSTLLLLSGCYSGISGRVVDADTGNPIGGAVVLAQWASSHGLGLTYHTISKTTETETDRDGRFSISGNYNPLDDPPVLIICKKGYVPWRNDKDFMDKLWTQYDKVIWQNNMTYKLTHWRDEYSYEQLGSFIIVSGTSITNAPKFSAYGSYILKKALDEIETKKKNAPEVER